MKTHFLRISLLSACASFALVSCGGGGAGGSLSAPIAPGADNGGSSSSALGSGPFKQLDRLNRPAVNEVFATFAEHQKNNVDTPDDDRAILAPEIVSFTTNVAGRSSAIANVLASVLTPDVQIADMSGTSLSCIGMAPGTCNNYLGIETGGATQLPKGLKPFGGRALTDDIVDISLSAIFGNVIPALKLAPDDGKESDGRPDPSYPSGHRPQLTTDGVSWQTAPKHFQTTFPYLGTAH
jgi:hypothetical protein